MVSARRWEFPRGGAVLAATRADGASAKWLSLSLCFRHVDRSVFAPRHTAISTERGTEMSGTGAHAELSDPSPSMPLVGVPCSFCLIRGKPDMPSARNTRNVALASTLATHRPFCSVYCSGEGSILHHGGCSSSSSASHGLAAVNGMVPIIWGLTGSALPAHRDLTTFLMPICRAWRAGNPACEIRIKRNISSGPSCCSRGLMIGVFCSRRICVLFYLRVFEADA